MLPASQAVDQEPIRVASGGSDPRASVRALETVSPIGYAGAVWAILIPAAAAARRRWRRSDTNAIVARVRGWAMRSARATVGGIASESGLAAIRLHVPVVVRPSRRARTATHASEGRSHAGRRDMVRGALDTAVAAVVHVVADVRLAAIGPLVPVAVGVVQIDENTALIERRALAHTRLATAGRALWGDVVARARRTASAAVGPRVQVGLAPVRSLVPVAVAPSCSAHARVAGTTRAGRCHVVGRAGIAAGVAVRDVAGEVNLAAVALLVSVAIGPPSRAHARVAGTTRAGRCHVVRRAGDSATAAIVDGRDAPTLSTGDEPGIARHCRLAQIPGVVILIVRGRWRISGQGPSTLRQRGCCDEHAPQHSP